MWKNEIVFRFVLSTFQLNSLDLGSRSNPNVFWHLPEPLPFFESCGYVGSEQHGILVADKNSPVHCCPNLRFSVFTLHSWFGFPPWGDS